MAVKVKEEIQEKLILEIDNGDFHKLKEVIEKWKFKDYQSFLRFSVGAFILSEENSISIKMDGKQQMIAPASDLIK